MKHTRALLAAAACALFAGCAADYTITLRNRANVDLVPYPVVTTPPPPHREADPANTLAHNTEASIDPTGFNPLYYHAASQTGLMMQLGLDGDPPALLLRVTQHVVEPGQEGGDPSLQPQVVSESLYEPTKLDLVFTLRPQGAGFPVDFEEN